MRHKVFTIQTLRRLVQAGFAGFIAYLAVRHAVLGEELGGASPEAYCPFGGIETLYSYVSTGGQLIKHTHLSNLVVLVAVIATALLAKSAFCGWICPFGTFQDWLNALGRPVRDSRVWKSLSRTLVDRYGFGPGMDRLFRYGKFAVLAWILWGTISAGVMVFRDYDPYAALINLAEATLNAGMVILIVTALVSLVSHRPWCKYACPLGALVGLAGMASPIKPVRNPETCTNCRLCDRACAMGVKVSTAKAVTSPECNGCLACVEACPKAGALDAWVGPVPRRHPAAANSTGR